jgi:hypothetical protein
MGRFGSPLSRAAVCRRYDRVRRHRPSGNSIAYPAASLATARSVSLPVGDEFKIFRQHLGEECLVLALRQRPQDRRGLLAGVPVLAAADPALSS